MIRTVKGFNVVNEAEVDVFLESSCYVEEGRAGVRECLGWLTSVMRWSGRPHYTGISDQLAGGKRQACWYRHKCSMKKEEEVQSHWGGSEHPWCDGRRAQALVVGADWVTEQGLELKFEKEQEATSCRTQCKNFDFFFVCFWVFV